MITICDTRYGIFESLYGSNFNYHCDMYLSKACIWRGMCGPSAVYRYSAVGLSRSGGIVGYSQRRIAPPTPRAPSLVKRGCRNRV